MLPYILAEFREDASREIAAIRTAIAANDFQSLSAHNRALQDIGACVGAKALLQRCQTMEGHLRDSQEQHLAAGFESLAQCFESTIKAVAKTLVT